MSHHWFRGTCLPKARPIRSPAASVPETVGEMASWGPDCWAGEVLDCKRPSPSPLTENILFEEIRWRQGPDDIFELWQEPDSKPERGQRWPLGHIWTAAVCFGAAQTQKLLSTFKWLKKKYFVTQEKLHEIQMPVSINKVLLEHSPAHWFTSCPGLFPLQGKMGAVTETSRPSEPVFTICPGAEKICWPLHKTLCFVSQ